MFRRAPFNENCDGPNGPELRAAEKAGLKRAFQLEGTKDAYDKVITFDSALTTVAASGLFDRLMGEKHATREEQACNFIVQVFIGSHLLSSLHTCQGWNGSWKVNDKNKRKGK